MALSCVLLTGLFGCHFRVFLVLLALAEVTVSANYTSDVGRAVSLVSNIERESGPFLAEVFCALDSDHDGMLTKDEAARGMARSLGKDAEQFHMLWAGWKCYRKQNKSPPMFAFISSAV
eukprot:TRINITY_DN48829_c0_g1_i1.p1 TRINITY_DN48829_c0_g1~~TRINITY_DN48829_c0_g1_i1.p1  ORF type:complete len:119 (-),score=23.85 TRINITY_DN48829_c0_g1_i1:138-494(-)